MPIDDTAPVRITAFDWVPDFAKGQVRDLRVRWALEEVGQPYAVTYLPQGSQKAPPHRARQPFGQVPTYEEGDLTLFESGAIVLHIAESHGKLLPADRAGRSRAIEWAFAALNTVEPPIMDHAIATLFEAGEPWSKPRLPAVEKRIDERLGELSARLGTSDWLDGDFSAGDLLIRACSTPIPISKPMSRGARRGLRSAAHWRTRWQVSPRRHRPSSWNGKRR
jgi:glutathione S-transferase